MPSTLGTLFMEAYGDFVLEEVMSRCCWSVDTMETAATVIDRVRGVWVVTSAVVNFMTIVYVMDMVEETEDVVHGYSLVHLLLPAMFSFPWPLDGVASGARSRRCYERR